MIGIRTHFVSVSIVLALGTEAEKTWVSIPIRAPARLELGSYNRHYADMLLGTPLQNMSFVPNIATSTSSVHTSECVFCSPESIYDPSYSSTVKMGNETFGHAGYRGNLAYETVVLGGILRALESPIDFVEYVSPTYGLRVTGGSLGLFVTPTNHSTAPGSARSILLHMHEQDQLLNPVWGLRLGGEDPRLTIGALDSNEYRGEINWVPANTESGFPVIEVDTLRGYRGNVFPYQYPIKVRLDSYSAIIGIPDLATYRANQTLLGPQELNELMDGNQSFVVRCDGTLMPNTPLELSAEINGIVYPLSTREVIFPSSRFVSSGTSTADVCMVGVYEVEPSLHQYSFGLPFVRSMYIAYRFPTKNCPGYWGFATPKGSPVPVPTQTPRATPTDFDTCLSLIKPTSTPTPTATAQSTLFDSDGKKYPVYARPSDQWVELKGVGDLKMHKVTGESARKGA